jgi:hypothetical protein
MMDINQTRNTCHTPSHRVDSRLMDIEGASVFPCLQECHASRAVLQRHFPEHPIKPRVDHRGRSAGIHFKMMNLKPSDGTPGYLSVRIKATLSASQFGDQLILEARYLKVTSAASGNLECASVEAVFAREIICAGTQTMPVMSLIDLAPPISRWCHG